MLTHNKKNTFIVGKWEVDPLHNTIRCGSEQLDIEPKAMQVLEYLARHAGRTIHRDTLFEVLWPKQVVTEGALTRVISHLRRCLDDLSKRPRYIVTVRKTGYRLIANVSAGGYFDSYPINDISPGLPPSSRPTKFWSRIIKFTLLSIVPLTIYFTFDELHTNSTALHKVRYITTDLGEEMSPVISPDGLNIAYIKYTLNENKGANENTLYTNTLLVKNILNNNTASISLPEGYVSHLAWAPDNSHIGFAHEVKINQTDIQFGIYSKNIETGELKLLVKTLSHNHGISWSPDGQYLIYADSPHQNQSKYIYRLEISTGKRKLILPFDENLNPDYSYPKYSPDGNRIAVIRTDQAAYNNIDLLDVRNDSIESIANSEFGVLGLEWKDDATLFVISGAVGTSQLLELSIDGGKVKYIDLKDKHFEYISYSKATKRLAYESIMRPYNIHVTRFSEDKISAIDSLPYTKSNRLELEAIERLDGQYTALVSSRSGAFEIWLKNNLNQQSQQLTTLNAHAISGMDWSPDQDKLSFVATIDHKQAIYWYDVQGRQLGSLSQGDSRYSLIGWQNDNTFLFSSNYEQQWRLWRYHTELKTVTLVSGRPIMHGRLSPDRQQLYFVLHRRAGIWKSSLDGENAIQVPGTEDISVFKSWTVSEKGIFYFLYGNMWQPDELYFLHFDTSKTALVARSKNVYLNRIYWVNDHLYYCTYGRRESDIALIETL